MTDKELKEIREHMERCYTGLNDSAFDDVVCLIAHIDHLQTALDAANKRAEAAEGDIILISAGNSFCEFCKTDKKWCYKCRHKNGSYPQSFFEWRGPQDNENMV